MKLPRRLVGRTGVVLDTMVFIYLFEDAPRFGPVCEFIVDQAAKGRFHGVITPVTAAEVLVKPLQQNRTDLADRYRFSLGSLKNIEPVGLPFGIGFLAAGLRARYRMPLPDMVQAACALQSKTPILITNDRSMRKVEELTVLLMEDFV